MRAQSLPSLSASDTVTTSPSKLSNRAAATPCSGKSKSLAGRTSPSSSAASAPAGSSSALSLFSFLPAGGGAASANLSSGLCAREGELAAVGGGQHDAFDLRRRQVEELLVEPVRGVARKIERAAREPGLRVAGLPHIDAVIAAAQLIDAALAGDDLAQERALLVAHRDERRFRVRLVGILDLEARDRDRASGSSARHR